jgi:hypothetical protein
MAGTGSELDEWFSGNDIPQANHHLRQADRLATSIAFAFAIVVGGLVLLFAIWRLAVGVDGPVTPSPLPLMVTIVARRRL